MKKVEQCYGFILVLEQDHNKFLILEQQGAKGDWTFPKGHHEKGESALETALRETKEESGIDNIRVLNKDLIHEEYEITINGEKRLKSNDYFIGSVKDKMVVIQTEEIQSYKWVSFEEALASFKYETRKKTLKEAKKYLESYASHISH